MTKRPWMPWDVPAYMADTRTFTLEQHGAYLLLLGVLWMNDGALPDDESVLARAVGIGVRRWRKIRDPIMEKLTIENGEVTQKRLLAETIRANEITAKRKHSGALGGMTTSLKYKNVGRANARANGPANGQQTGQQKSSISPSNSPRQSQSHINTTTSESVAAREESVTDRASSSGLEGPTPPSESSKKVTFESSKQVSSQGGEASWLVHLPAKRREAVKAAFERSGRDPSTGERITG